VTTRAESEGRKSRELDRSDWGGFFDDINRRLEDGEELEATIELVTKEVVGPEAERLPLASVTYEDGDDEVAIGVGGRGARFPAVLWHFVESPRRVWVMERDGGGGEPAVIAIESEGGDRTLLHLDPAG
jgi:hypothetical protein